LCDSAVVETDSVTMPRPVLGALAFSNGMRIGLDRSAIVGRSPRTERVSANEIPQLVVVPSPEADISRNHVEVRLEGWHVLVVDLDSTNGTVVTVPGQAPQRLRPRAEVPIVPGTVVSLADEVTFTYEVEP
jgi:pSer/pThr/pTyr-binding forkhead associated (FHA) protein